MPLVAAVRDAGPPGYYSEQPEQYSEGLARCMKEAGELLGLAPPQRSSLTMATLAAPQTPRTARPGQLGEKCEESPSRPWLPAPVSPALRHLQDQRRARGLPGNPIGSSDSLGKRNRAVPVGSPSPPLPTGALQTPRTPSSASRALPALPPSSPPQPPQRLPGAPANWLQESFWQEGGGHSKRSPGTPSAAAASQKVPLGLQISFANGTKWSPRREDGWKTLAPATAPTSPVSKVGKRPGIARCETMPVEGASRNEGGEATDGGGVRRASTAPLGADAGQPAPLQFSSQGSREATAPPTLPPFTIVETEKRNRLCAPLARRGRGRTSSDWSTSESVAGGGGCDAAVAAQTPFRRPMRRPTKMRAARQAPKLVIMGDITLTMTPSRTCKSVVASSGPQILQDAWTPNTERDLMKASLSTSGGRASQAMQRVRSGKHTVVGFEEANSARGGDSSSSSSEEDADDIMGHMRSDSGHMDIAALLRLGGITAPTREIEGRHGSGAARIGIMGNQQRKSIVLSSDLRQMTSRKSIMLASALESLEPDSTTLKDKKGKEGADAMMAMTKKNPQELWTEVFKKLAEEGQIHRDELPRALELCGFAKPNVEWVDVAYAPITKYNLIGLDDFKYFVEKYEIEQTRNYHEAFIACDEDASGFVETPELVELLKSFGVEPMGHVLQQVIDEVDEDVTGTLDFEEFQNVMKIVLTRECFTKEEYEDLQLVYTRFDRDSSGEIEVVELMAILNYLGYSMSHEEVHEIAREVDSDGSGSINWREFLICMRHVRDKHVEALKQAVLTSDKDGSGTISVQELGPVLTSLGYQSDPVALRDAALEAELDPEDDELDLGELWRLITVYRQRECLCSEDLAEVEFAFQRYDKTKAGEISTVDVGKLLRYLGYPLPFEVQQQLVSRVDIDGSGLLDVMELRKIIRMEKEKELGAIKRVWERFSEGDEMISKEEAETGVQMLDFPGGIKPKAKIMPIDLSPSKDGTAELLVDYAGFVSVVARAMKEARQDFRENKGFTQKELREFEEQFARFDTDNSGELCNEELVCVLDSVFPHMAKDKAQRPKLLQLLSEADADGNGRLDFGDFLRLMRQFRDLQDSERVAKEKLALEETGFAPPEVADFRELFLLAARTKSGRVTLEELKGLVAGICPLGEKNTQEFTSLVREITVRTFGSVLDAAKTTDVSIRDEADFPEFLMIMKKLLDVNFANIQERTQGAAH
eukprot:TRINITY_DN4791_c0_g1_i1.p1 TRINITY_DN4791_c0_g1~~TRINITY_DN4791_c0_g1_i1.p1  ORF type:complete len:1217 (+),score=383.09 TRINITY_DN4791_c0_g1_i1:164-3814(+)